MPFAPQPVITEHNMTKRLARTRIDAELGVIRAALENDANTVHAGLSALGFFAPDDPRFDRELVLEHVRAINAWYANDKLVTLNPQYVSALLAHAGDPRSKYWDLMKNETIPAESLLSSRMQIMTLSTVGQFSATANWHRIMSEWLCGSLPTSPLASPRLSSSNSPAPRSERRRHEPRPFLRPRFVVVGARMHPRSTRDSALRAALAWGRAATPKLQPTPTDNEVPRARESGGCAPVIRTRRQRQRSDEAFINATETRR
jgi:hypothetical protein